MNPQRVNMITLGVTNLNRAKTFYGDLGWVPVKGDNDIVFYQLHGMILALFGRAALAEDQGRKNAEIGTGAMTLAQNFLTKEDVDAAYALALQAGAIGMKTPQDVFWGGYSGYYTDPDGHVWEVAMNPFSPPNADGSQSMTPD